MKVSEGAPKILKALQGVGDYGGLEVGGMYEFRHVNGHIEVFLDGEFQFSADTMQEAYSELKAG